ncbi:MAG: DUF6268 family outer membrane beta-barrel protein [Burkholderiales bacterium]
MAIGLTQFDTDLDSGGSFDWGGGAASAAVVRQFSPQFAGGVSVRYEYQRWNFSEPARFGGRAPWRDVRNPEVGLSFVYAPSDEWQVLVAPSVSWAYANGASAGDAVQYGAVAIASRDFSPTLTLGVGAAVFRQIDETKVFPFVAVRWQIDDHWTLANPFEGGPTGGAGLELTYTFANGWEAGFGGTYRSYAFRLGPDGPAPNGIGENAFIPIFFRLSRNVGKEAQVDLYAAALANGTLKVKNQDGNEVARDDYRTAPALALTFRYSF